MMIRTIQERTKWIALLLVTVFTSAGWAAPITTAGQPAQLDICIVGAHSVRVTLKPVTFEGRFPFTPALAQREYPDATISLRELTEPLKRQVGSLTVEVRPDPLRVVVTNAQGQPVQDLIFTSDGNLTFHVGDQPVLGMGEGGPQPSRNWRAAEIEFDRRGRLHEMRPRWQSNAYGSRNPVALLIGTEGWGLFVATPWGQIDLRTERGEFIPWVPPESPTPDPNADRRERSRPYSRMPRRLPRCARREPPCGGRDRIGERPGLRRVQTGSRRPGQTSGPRSLRGRDSRRPRAEARRVHRLSAPLCGTER